MGIVFAWIDGAKSLHIYILFSFLPFPPFLYRKKSCADSQDFFGVGTWCEYNYLLRRTQTRNITLVILENLAIVHDTPASKTHGHVLHIRFIVSSYPSSKRSDYSSLELANSTNLHLHRTGTPSTFFATSSHQQSFAPSRHRRYD